MQEETVSETALSPQTAIRVETALSRYPVHRLAKRGDIAIDIKEESGDGDLLTRWEVDYSKKHGQPGPLAYKLDTLIINRRIEEASRPIPRIIKLGSLRDICRELGLSEGKNVNAIRKALRQNAFAGITARICYRQSDGAEQTLEADFTRYSVVFTGEKLPDGQKADAVYLILNEVFMQVINGAMTRPLDYDYLRSLPPAPQRFYELVSYQMYAALKYDRPRAKLSYSSLCTYGPQTRYFNWEQARKQMAKVHALHRKSGYIVKVEFQQTTDGEGRPDWLMLYTPGPRARAEYRAFTGRGGPSVIEIAPLSLEPAAPAPKPRQLQFALEPLAMELISRDVTQSKALALVRDHPAEKIAQKIELFDWLMGKGDKRIGQNPAGYLVKAIEDDYAAPKGFVPKAERERRAEARKQKERAAAEVRRREQEAKAREQAERKAIDAYWDSLSAEEQDALQAAADAEADPADLKKETGPLKRMGRLIRRQAHIRRLLESRQALPDQ